MKNPNPESATDLVAFDLDAVPEPLFEHDGTVYRAGKLFEADSYPDKDFSMTPAELVDAVESFQTGDAPVDFEHMPTVLSGRLGEVVAVEASDDGKDLRGIVALPKWLDDAMGSTSRKVSATWNRATKKLEGLALVLSPRVKDAALFAAFNQAQQEGVLTMTQPALFAGWDRATIDDLPDTSFLWVAPDGMRHLPVRDKNGNLSVPQLAEAVRRLSQPAAFSGTTMPQDAMLTHAETMLQDAVSGLEMLARFAFEPAAAAAAPGAAPAPGAKPALTPDAQGALQTIHDMCAKAGAVCPSADAPDPNAAPAGAVAVAPGKPKFHANMSGSTAAIQGLHDLVGIHGAKHLPDEAGATQATASTTTVERKGKRVTDDVSIWKRFVQFMAQNPTAVDNLADTGLAVEAADRAAATTAGTTTATAATMAAAAPKRSAAEEENVRLRGELAASEAENRRISAQRIADDAVRFADGYIREGQAFPTERQQIMQAFIQASTDDILLPGSVTFADGKQGSRVAVLTAAYDARPAHQLTSESLGAGVFAVLANAPTTETNASRAEKPMDPADVKKLIESTALGRAAMGLAAKGSTGANGVNGTNH